MKVNIIIKPIEYYFRKFLHMVIPGQCLLCSKESISYYRQICSECYIRLPWLGRSCPTCLQLVLKGMHLCENCVRRKEKKIDYMMAPFFYAGPAKSLVLKLKYNQDSVCGTILARILAEDVLLKYRGKNLPQVIIPVPASIERHSDLGFNQTIELAKYVSAKLKVPYDIYSCKKIKDTNRQGKLDRGGRVENLKNCFKVEANKYKHVAIIDDVITTGSTVYSLAKELYASGVLRVDAWGCCKVSY